MKNNKGITLIALVITIIVLLILSGISIAMLTGSNGILQKATEADVETARGEACDRINIALNGVFADLIAAEYDAGTLPEDGDEILQQNGIDEGSVSGDVGSYEIEYTKENTTTSKTGNVLVITWKTPDAVKYGGDIQGSIERVTTEKGKVPYIGHAALVGEE